MAKVLRNFIGLGVLLFAFPLSAETVRQSRARDALEISQLSQGRTAWTQAQAEAGIAHPTKKILVLENDHHVVGFLRLELRGDTFYVDRLQLAEGVGPEGAAAAIAEYTQRVLLTKAAPRIEFAIPEKQTALLNALSKNGITATHTEGRRIILVHDHTHEWKLKPSELKRQTFYERLGLPASADRRQIQEAHRKRTAANAENVTAVRLLDEAFATLDAPDKKRQYDEALPFFPSLGRLGPGTDQAPAAAPLTFAPEFSSANFYRRLGVPENASPSTIRNAYLSLYPQHELTPDMAAIREAFLVLNQPTLRAEYDRILTTVPLSRQRGETRALVQIALEERQGEKSNEKAYDIYAVLGVLPSDTTETIQNKFAASDKSLEKMKAYLILRDPLLRKYYEKTAKRLDNESRRTLVDQIYADAEPLRKKLASPEKALGYERPTELYEMFNLHRAATQKELDAAFTKLVGRSGLSPSDRIAIAHGYEVLSHRDARREYDRYLEDPFLKVNPDLLQKEIGYLLSSLRVMKTMEELGRNQSLTQLIEDTKLDVSRIATNPSLLRNYLKVMRAAVDKINDEPDPVGAGHLAMARLNELGRIILREGYSAEYLNATDEVRTQVIEHLVANDRATWQEREALLKSYLAIRPPDQSAANLRNWRDKVPRPDECHFSDLKRGA